MPDVITIRDYDYSDDDAPIVEYCRGRSPNADTTRTIPENWVGSRIALAHAGAITEQPTQRNSGDSSRACNATPGTHAAHAPLTQSTQVS